MAEIDDIKKHYSKKKPKKDDKEVVSKKLVKIDKEEQTDLHITELNEVELTVRRLEEENKRLKLFKQQSQQSIDVSALIIQSHKRSGKLVSGILPKLGSKIHTKTS